MTGRDGSRQNITELQQFSSDDTGRFFMRVQVQTGFNQTQFAEQVAPLAAMLDARWNLDLVGRRRRTLVLVSKAGHCLNDLLYRQRAGQVPIQIAKIMSNHPDLEGMASFYGVPFENHVVLPHTKPDFEAEVLKAVREYDIELVVLARFMQILSPELCDALAGRAINIHHSFLPGFRRQPLPAGAHRGVKLIGATATSYPDLDEADHRAERPPRGLHRLPNWWRWDRNRSRTLARR